MLTIRTLFVTTVVAAYGLGAQAPSALEGAWEGVIEAVPRPYVVAVQFGSGVVKLDAAGSTPFKIEDVSTQAGRARFRFTVGGAPLQFEGQQAAAEIRGAVHMDDREVPFWLHRLPDLPAPRDRVEAWQQDLDDLLARFLRYERSYSADAQAAFRRWIAELRRTLAARPDQEVIVELARAIAIGGNAHTRLYLMRNRTEMRRLPIRVWWFKDGLYVVRATPENSDLLGCRILKIGAKDAAAVADRMQDIKAGNASWQRYMSAYFLTSPDLLFGARLIPSPEQVALTVSRGGGKRDVRLVPLPLRKDTAPVEAWWDLAPGYRDSRDNSVPALRPEKAALYLRKPQQNYWMEDLPGSKAIYVQYNRSQEMTGGISVKDFTAGLLREIEEREPTALIVDLRFNTGGNLEVGTPLMKAVADKAGRVPVYVLTGRATFSAGITAVAQLKQWARATIAGEQVGDGLDLWAEGGNLTLPNSKLTVHYANGFHNYSKREYPGRPRVMELRVDSIQPDLVVEPAWADYLQGRDPVLEAVEEKITRVGNPRH